jgi:protein O-mannosyl-transferase
MTADQNFSTSPLAARPARNVPRLAAAALAALVAIVYARTFSAPFVFDDLTAIRDNATIRHLWPPGAVLSPPISTTAGGRPVVNLTLALNYSVSGLDPWSYHALNLLIHAGVGLLLFGIVRQTLARLASRGSPAQSETWLALTATALWLLHPLQTESVTYVIQRAESLMAFFYLLTLYAFIRSLASSVPRCWLGFSFASCLLGMATKEVMVSAPLVVFLYSRTFVTGSMREAWRRHGGFVVALAGTWLLLGWLVLGTQGRGGSAGFNAGVTPWSYALTQCGALVHYVALACWPHPLILDYGTDLVTRVSDAALPAAAVIAALAATGWALVRRPAVGFAGVWFFALLAPTSSFVPVATQSIAEHRMYLPLAALVVTAVVGAHRRIGSAALWCGLAVALAFTLLTWRRNADYQSVLALWTDTVAKRPDNARAHCSLADALAATGRTTEAAASYATSLRLDPTGLEAHDGLGALLLEAGRADEARTHFETALRLEPDETEAHNRRGALLARAGRADEALPHFQEALKRQPARADFRTNYGAALLQLGRKDEAVAEFEAALRLRPDFAEAHSDLALVLLQSGRLSEAAAHYAAVLRTTPRDPVAHGNLGFIALQNGHAEEAVSHYRAVVLVSADEPGAHVNLGHALLRAGRPLEARVEYEAALRVEPDNVAARDGLARLRGR